AQYPAKPIRLVVPFPAGESVDATARLVGQSWSAALGQQILVDNRGGAGGTIGSEAVAKSAPDGYTLLWGNVGPFAIGPGLYEKLGYDVAKDFESVSLVATLPFVLFASPVLPENSVIELVAYAKAHPGEINFGATGVGSGLHLIAEVFKSVAGIQIEEDRRGLWPASHRRGLQERCRHPDRPRALQGRRAGAPRDDVGQGADRLQYHPRVPAARQIRAPEGARHHLDFALAPPARRPDDSRSRAPGRARRILARCGRSCRNAARNRQQAERDARGDNRRAGVARRAHRARRAAGRKHSGGVEDFHAGRGGEVGPRDPILRRARGLSVGRVVESPGTPGANEKGNGTEAMDDRF